ncbi:ABC transporter ATP-binding protein [Sphingomonas sp. LB2R24]|uniref:ABC transporter ATP-binding protein n=1 Tax=Sphingomonas sorbitolis TaxID=3096165 RepID=UPI002FCB8779
MGEIVKIGVKKVQNLDFGWHTDNMSGSSGRVITRAPQAYAILMGSLFLNLLPSALLIIVTSAAVVAQSALAAASFIIAGLAYYLAVWRYNQTQVLPHMFAVFAEDSRVSGELIDLLANSMAVKSWAAEERERQRIGNTVDVWSKRMAIAWNVSVNSEQLQQLLSAMILLVPTAVGVLEFRAGRMEPSIVAVVIGSGFVLRGWLSAVSRGMLECQRAATDMAEYVALLDRECELQRDRGKLPFVPSVGKIEFRNVIFAYEGSGRLVFDRLSVTLHAGQTTAIIGPSGSGKTTFVKLLLALYRPISGQILFDRQDLSKCTASSVRESIALVPQDPVLFHRSIGENIAFGVDVATESEIVLAAEQSQLKNLIESLPAGYQTFVGERGVKLSGGERQRVVIARALISKRSMLVFDEATSSLDGESERLVHEALEEAKHSRTTIMIAHRLSTIKNADRILVFEGGSIIEDGSPEELLAIPGGYYARLIAAGHEANVPL